MLAALVASPDTAGLRPLLVTGRTVAGAAETLARVCQEDPADAVTSILHAASLMVRDQCRDVPLEVQSKVLHDALDRALVGIDSMFPERGAPPDKEKH